jgi:hypothetical protein
MGDKVAIGLGLALAAMGVASPAHANSDTRFNEAFVDGCALLASYDGSTPLDAPRPAQQNAVVCKLLIEASVGVAQASDGARAGGRRICIPEDVEFTDVARVIASRRRSIIDAHPEVDPAAIVLIALGDAYASDASD